VLFPELSPALQPVRCMPDIGEDGMHNRATYIAGIKTLP
jgi:hypothetical protein